ncbi:hypothetical protein HMI55_003075 [Coelomomyces lativittatus]|nr:hypothetical protein HMI55_003075 [Coelomomyces lativittatus]
MQLDEDVGKVAQATPVMIAKASELFMYSLLEKSLEQARQLQSQRISPYHMKKAILIHEQFDFIRSLVESIQDESDEPKTKRRRKNDSNAFSHDE